MKKIIFSIILMIVLMSMSISYAALDPWGYSWRDPINSAMSFVILGIVIFFVIKLPKADDKKRLIVKFINILSIAIILKLSSWFLPYIIAFPFFALGGF